MSADSHLSPGQFPSMPMHQILGLPSGDARKGGTVRDVLSQKSARVEKDPYLRDLREDMRSQGQTFPINITHDDGEQTVRNGHHRIAIAHQLGWTHMTYSPDITDSGEEFHIEDLDNAVAAYHGNRR